MTDMHDMNLGAHLSRRQVMRTGGLALGASFLASALAACSNDGGGGGETSSDGVTSIEYQYAWLANAQILGYAVAQELGYYTDRGLNVTFRDGGPSTDVPTLIGSGQVAMGTVSSSVNHMAAVAADVSATAVAVGFQEHPFAFISLADNPIRSAEDLRGSRIGTQPENDVLIKAVLNANDISVDDVEIIGVGSDTGALLAGQVDSWTGWNVNYGQLRPLEGNYETLRLWDLGIPLYAQVAIANNDFLAENPGAVDNLLIATGLGWEYARDNLEESIQILKSQHPDIDEDVEMESAKLILDVVFTDQTTEHGWGQMSPDVWQEQLDTFERFDAFQGGAPDVNDVMNMGPIERTQDERPTGE